MCTTDAIFCSDAESIVEQLEQVRREEAALHARRARLIDALSRANTSHEHRIVVGIDRPSERAAFVERCTCAQVACALRVTERTAARLLHEAASLVGDLSHTLDLLDAGQLSYPHAAAVVGESHSLPADSVADFERAVLSGRRDLSTSRFAERCRRVRERMHPSTIEERAVFAERNRSVSIEFARDGMAWLSAYLPGAQAELVDVLLTGTAKSQQDAGDDRTLGQLRADALVDAVLHGGTDPVPAGADAVRGARVGVSITVPALTLLGAGDEPAELDGYGPIPLETAKVLAAQATSWRRILTHPITGVALAHDRTTYRVPTELREWLAERDETCRFPGCGRRARGCDVDHVIAWEHGGGTDHDNLAHLCRRHHRLKHHTTWEPQFDGDDLVWSTPSGQTYASAPADREPSLR